MEQAAVPAAAPAAKIPRKRTKTIEIADYKNVSYIFDPVNGIQLCEQVIKPSGVDFKIHGTIPFKDFLKALDDCGYGKGNSKDIGVSGLGFINTNIIKFYKNRISENGKSKHTIIAEFNPCRVNINYVKKDDAGLQQVIRYDLPLPYVQFYCSFSQLEKTLTADYTVFITCSTSPIIDLNSPVSELPINNIGVGGGVCWGEKGGINVDPNITIEKYVQKIANNFFSLNFNKDLPPTDSTLPYHLWTKMTQEEILKHKFTRNYRVSDILRSLQGNNNAPI